MFQNFTLVVIGILGNIFSFIAPLWIAVIFGVVVVWAWKPKWAIEPNTHDWTSSFKFRVPWSNDSELRNQPGFLDSSGSASEGEKGLRGLDSDRITAMTDVADVLIDTTMETVASQAPVSSEVAITAADSYLPVQALQYVIDVVHSFSGRNWWASRVLITLLI
ncbi:hypothetical protein KIW84_052775 [Lathyrus oleraceus]|uniref:Uncharacterized protein n=1 Tax=Pisum sativum TaxID=3888 RepID=A0A9D5AHW3_PEA|nr:hypothetical protein KIW84_052775 [Pisum sativum]